MNPGKLPRSVKPPALVQRKARPSMLFQEVPTTWPESLIPAAKLSVMPGMGPKSVIPVLVLHRKACSGPAGFDNRPTIWAEALIPMASLELKEPEWMSVIPTSLLALALLMAVIQTPSLLRSRKLG